MYSKHFQGQQIYFQKVQPPPLKITYGGPLNSQSIFTRLVFSATTNLRKNFDIHFSMKRQAWRMSRLFRRLF